MIPCGLCFVLSDAVERIIGLSRERHASEIDEHQLSV